MLLRHRVPSCSSWNHDYSTENRAWTPAQGRDPKLSVGFAAFEQQNGKDAQRAVRHGIPAVQSLTARCPAPLSGVQQGSPPVPAPFPGVQPHCPVPSSDARCSQPRSPHSPSGCSPCSAAAAPPGTPGSAEGSGAHHRGRSRSPAWLRGAGRGGSHGMARLGSAREAGMEGGGVREAPARCSASLASAAPSAGPGLASPWDGGTARGGGKSVLPWDGGVTPTPGTGTGVLVSHGVALSSAGYAIGHGDGDIHCWGQRWKQCPANRHFLLVCGIVASYPPGDRDTNLPHSPPRRAVPLSLSQGPWWGSDAATALQHVDCSWHHHWAVPGTPTPNPLPGLSLLIL